MLQELRVEDHGACIVEDTDFVLQPPEVDTRLSADARIDHRKQGRGDVDVVDASLEGGGSKASQVGHHTTTYIY